MSHWIVFTRMRSVWIFQSTIFEVNGLPQCYHFLKNNEDHKEKTNEDYKPTKINSNFNTELAAKVAVENERFANLPPVRECGVVEFSFSERQFPAPKRESNKGWLILEGILISVRSSIRSNQMAVHLTV